MDPLPQAATPGTGLGLTQYIGGIVAVKSASQMIAEEKAQAVEQNNRSYVTNLADHIRRKWSVMKDAKQQTVESRLLQCLRQRRGEYDPDKLQQIKQQGGSEIYLMLSSNKARAASSWVRDVMGGAGSDKPWAAEPTPKPDMPPHLVQAAYQSMQMELHQEAMLGIQPSPEELEEFVTARKSMIVNQLREQAREAAQRMELKMEDQLAEGGFGVEFSKFIDDLATFPYAVMKGPVVKKQKTFKWAPTAGGGFDLQVTEELLPTWARVDPFMIYWASHATQPDDGDLAERHRLTRADLNAMIGVEGYSEKAIRAVLDEYGRGGLRDWLWVDTAKADAEGKSLASALQNDDELIDAVQFWGSVQGKMLIEWGIDEGQVEDPLADYPIEAWLIGTWVIKAVINPDPLDRKPYYKAAYEEIPGSWMGNSPMDLIRDCQDVCNATARALVNNMGIASGPQVWINVDRLPAGEPITQLYPWKIHQTTSDPMGGTAPPVGFFQPSSMTQELMAVYERFSVLADEYSGIPRYMTGDAPTGGAGRTASGMNMLMNNAGKAIKQVIANIDRHIIEPLIERLWHYNMRYSDDPELKNGDVKIVARGAKSLLVRETAAQRRNELLQIALSSPVAQQIMGLDGTAYLLREQVKTLEMNADRIVPPPEIVKARAMVQQAMQQRAMAMQPQQEGEGSPNAGASQQRTPRPVSDPNQYLMNGAPVTDNFSPMSMN